MLVRVLRYNFFSNAQTCLDAAKGNTVGLDQGIITCITLSDGQISKDDNHGWNLSKILTKLCRKKKGSNGFRRIQELRKNYINWSIN